MGWKYGLVLSALFVIVGLPPIGSNGGGRLSQEQTTSAETDALAVVQNYLELAGKPDLKEIVNITTPVPKGARKKPAAEPAISEPEPPPGTAIVTATALTRNGSLDWIRAGFPKSIAAPKRRIIQINKSKVEGPYAKIWVVLGTEEKVTAVPWVFMLAKEPDATWKIYEIQTPADAVDYMPVETNGP